MIASLFRSLVIVRIIARLLSILRLRGVQFRSGLDSFFLRLGGGCRHTINEIMMTLTMSIVVDNSYSSNGHNHVDQDDALLIRPNFQVNFMICS